MARHERAAFMGTCTVFAPILAVFVENGATHPMYHLALFALVVVALFSNLAAIQRAAYVMKRMPRPPAPPAEPEPAPEPKHTEELHA
jgi:hypothetical protein